MFSRKLRYISLVVSLLFSWQTKLLHAQQFADPSFYLLDSLNLEQLSQFDKELIDTSLTHYHHEKHDTSKLAHLLHIVDNCWDPQVWPRYNQYMIERAQLKLSTESKEIVRNRLIFILAGGISNIGFYYDERGDLLRALDYYHQGLKLYEQIENKAGISTTYNNLGVIYSVIEDTSKALYYHTKSLEYKKELNDVEGIAMSYNNIGTIYENSDNPFLALDYYKASLKLREQIDDIRGMAMSYDNIGDIYFAEEVYGKAYQYYQKGYELWKSVGIEVGLSTSLNNLANVFIKMKNYEQAEKFGLESMEIAEKLGFPIDIQNSAQTLMDVYQLKGNYEKALQYARMHMEMREKIKSDESAQVILKKTMQYEYQKMALKDSLEHEREREVQNLKLREKETQNYALFVGMGLLFAILALGVRSFQRKKKDNQKINEQKREVERQKTEIEKQHVALAATHQEISDSIEYAKRIQQAILPSSELLNHHLKNSFVYYQPKDIVSGDFYWIVKQGDNVIFAVADCTGHGVPGAMVSVVCHNALNRAVREFKLSEPASILDKTRELVVETFSQSQEMVKDGMDISLCSWNQKTNEIQWAGANNPLYVIRSGSNELETVEPDKQPIGNYDFIRSYTNHSLQLYPGDTIYLFSDGYLDQFGGPEGKKYKHLRFRELLLAHVDKPMHDQREIVKTDFENWKGQLEQLDDICIIGVRI